jgi:hypothetical protein
MDMDDPPVVRKNPPPPSTNDNGLDEQWASDLSARAWAGLHDSRLGF